MLVAIRRHPCAKFPPTRGICVAKLLLYGARLLRDVSVHVWKENPLRAYRERRRPDTRFEWIPRVVWKAVRLGRVAPEDVDAVLSAAKALPIASVDVAEPWRGAVARAIVADHPVYDALFVELAARVGATVVSYDRHLRKRFRSLVKTPVDVLES